MQMAARCMLIMGTLIAASLMISHISVAYAQSQISGKYVNIPAGYEITFPKGWSGIEFLGISTIVAPGGVDFFKGLPKTQMMTVHFNMTAFKDLQNAPGTLPAAENTCKQLSNRYISMNKVRAYEMIDECTTNGEFAKSKRYYFTNKDFIIVVGLSANSTKAYNDNIKLFEQAVKTVKVQKQTDIKASMSKIAGTKATTQKIDNKSVKLESTSTLSGFKFDKAKKALSFTVDGKKDAQGLTQISIGKLLKGSFKVSIDGKNVTDFVTIDDTTTKEILLSINYDHKKKHTITITGSKLA